jgi:hypothetical protein
MSDVYETRSIIIPDFFADPNADLDASRICSKLYMGSRPPEGERLAREGFRFLLLCAMEHQPSASKFPGVDVQHVPLDDHILPDDEWNMARAAAVLVERRVADGVRTLVTCSQGRNRSGLVVALALRRLYGMSGRAAVALVKRRRQTPVGEPLANPHFVRRLEKLTGKR